MVLEIDGDDSSTTTADVSELQLLIEVAAEEYRSTSSSQTAAQSSASDAAVVGAGLAGPQVAGWGR